MLIEFEFEIIHLPGKYHKAADAMTRLPQKSKNKTKEIAALDDDIPEYCIVRKESEPYTVLER